MRTDMLATLPTSLQPVTADTFLIPTLLPAPPDAFVGSHSLVIRGAEPIIVDTGSSLVREAWFDQVFSVVEPDDVQWVYLSHDDHDHVGNLLEVLGACPNATLVCNFFLVNRLSADYELPLHRMRWLEVGDSFDAGDRTLTLVRPPTFDSPTTRGLFDAKTGVLWAADAFGSLVPGGVYEAGDVPADLYAETFTALNGWNTPWLEWVDIERFTAHVQRVMSLPIEVSASAHGPILRGAQIDDAVRRTLDLANQPIVPTPGQETLDALVAAALDAVAQPAPA
jgi:flavorubredoxin